VTYDSESNGAKSARPASTAVSLVKREPYTGSKVQNPPTGGAPSGDKENGSNRSGQAALPVEANNPSVSTPPQPPSRTPARVNEEGGETANHGAKETPQVERNHPPVSTPPVSTAANSLPAGTPPPPQRRQRTRQPPTYLKDFVCDRINNGWQESLTRDRTRKLAAKSGSYEHHVNIKFGEGGVGGKTTTPVVHSSALAEQTRCHRIVKGILTKNIINFSQNVV